MWLVEAVCQLQQNGTTLDSSGKLQRLSTVANGGRNDFTLASWRDRPLGVGNPNGRIDSKDLETIESPELWIFSTYRW